MKIEGGSHAERDRYAEEKDKINICLNCTRSKCWEETEGKNSTQACPYYLAEYAKLQKKYGHSRLGFYIGENY